MRISRRSSRLTFEKTFLIVATTWRRTRFLDRFHSQVSPDLSTFPHCTGSPRFTRFFFRVDAPWSTRRSLPSFLPLLDPLQDHCPGPFNDKISLRSFSSFVPFNGIHSRNIWNRDRTVQIPDLPLSMGWWRWKRIERVWLRMIGCCCSTLEVT